MEWLFAAIIIIFLKIFWHQRNEKSSSLTFMFIYNFIMTFFFSKAKATTNPSFQKLWRQRGIGLDSVASVMRQQTVEGKKETS